MKFESGSLVTFRGREWLVLPQAQEDDTLLLKPLGGLEAEIVRIFPELEPVDSASFPLPDPAKSGDASSCALLRDAFRLGLRSATGPFRSLAHIAVEPRPYQLVPLLLALRQEIVRLLIADDVGIGKTVEALLIAREFLDRGEIKRLSILCPPHLAEQWQGEMEEKFHIEAELVLPSTIRRLERGLDAATSLFEKYPFTIVSLDYIKSDRHRDEFIRTCPEFVIVDEAHTCASSSGNRSKIQRFELVSALARNPARHMLFVTATPHSGKEEQFRSLLAFLTPQLANLPDDLGGSDNREHRIFLAKYFVQRRRRDIEDYADTRTHFPDRISLDGVWPPDKAWNELFNAARNLARKRIEKALKDPEARHSLRRGSYWAALALLLAISSSPAAALQALENRATNLERQDDGKPGGLDPAPSPELPDLELDDENTIAASLQDEDDNTLRSSLRKLAHMAKDLYGAKKDPKLRSLVPQLKTLLHDGFSPVIFCRYISTAEYLATELRKILGKELPEVAVEAVTGHLSPEERKERVNNLGKSRKRVLVCTDCLSEGINLQYDFNAIIHYDLSWNPTRHEQREGRVDRFGQTMDEVRMLTFYGKENPMDGMLLNVILRKHEKIRKDLGYAIPVPLNSEDLMETLLKSLILSDSKKADSKRQMLLPGIDNIKAQQDLVEKSWDEALKKERKRSQTYFSHRGMQDKSEDVAASLAEAQDIYGASQTVENFVKSACHVLNAKILPLNEKEGQKIYKFNFEDLSQAQYHIPELPSKEQCYVFEQPAKEGQIFLGRTHPFVEGLAALLAQMALDEKAENRLPRCGVMRTKAVDERHILLICRFRFEIQTGEQEKKSILAEECLPLAFTGTAQNMVWLDQEAVVQLLMAQPAENISSRESRQWLEKALSTMESIREHLPLVQEERAKILYEAHSKYRECLLKKNRAYEVRSLGEADILGFFVYLPAHVHKP